MRQLHSFHDIFLITLTESYALYHLQEEWETKWCEWKKKDGM